MWGGELIMSNKEKLSHVYKFLKISNERCSSCKEMQVDYYQRFIDLVQNKKLYFSKPSSFNDPFDCLVRFEETIKEKDFRAYLERKQITQWPDGAHSEAEAIEIMNNAYKKLGRIIADNVWGVSCFSKEWDNLLLWSHYADSHKGICIGFKTQFLLNSNCIRTKNFPFGDKMGSSYKNIMPLVNVKYSNTFPKFYNPYKESYDGLEQFLLTKSSKWSYEGEVRAILPYPEEFSRTIELCDSSINEIMFGAKIEQNVRDRILDNLNSINNSLSIYEVHLDKRTYSVYRKLINSPKS